MDRTGEESITAEKAKRLCRQKLLAKTRILFSTSRAPKSRNRKFVNYVARRALSSLVTGFLTSRSGPAVIAAIAAWVGAVNLSSSTENLTIRLTNFLSSKISPIVYLAGIIIAVGLSYRYPKTIMFLASLVLATFYLTPLYSTSTILESYKLILTLASIGFFTLALVFYGLKIRHRRRMIDVARMNGSTIRVN